MITIETPYTKIETDTHDEAIKQLRKAKRDAAKIEKQQSARRAQAERLAKCRAWNILDQWIGEGGDDA